MTVSEMHEEKKTTSTKIWKNTQNLSHTQINVHYTKENNMFSVLLYIFQHHYLDKLSKIKI